jgi:phospholipid N-methyltransferase
MIFAVDAPPQTRSSGWFFFRKFLRDPVHVASFWPSSRTLAARMVDDVPLRPGDWILELGPGTGAMTERVALRLEAMPGLRYLGIERDPEFHTLLCQRFPRLPFHCGDAQELRAIAAQAGCTQAGLILSGLPFASMAPATSRAILGAARDLLRMGGTFRTFSYLHALVAPGAHRLRRELCETFGSRSRDRLVWRNLPPAFVLGAG